MTAVNANVVILDSASHDSAAFFSSAVFKSHCLVYDRVQKLNQIQGTVLPIHPESVINPLSVLRLHLTCARKPGVTGVNAIKDTPGMVLTAQVG